MEDYWVVSTTDWKDQVSISLDQVKYIEFYTLDVPWIDEFGDLFPYTIKVVADDGQVFYFNHYCNGSKTGMDYSDYALYLIRLGEYYQRMYHAKLAL